MKNESLWATGLNNDGQLGDGTNLDSNTSVMIESSGVNNVTSAEGFYKVYFERMMEVSGVWAEITMVNWVMVLRLIKIHLYKFRVLPK